MDNFISDNISDRAHILKKSADIIKYVGDLILKEIKAGQKVTVIFPYRRPVYFLGKYLSDDYKASTDKVDMFSIDDFIDKCYETAAPHPFPKISTTEASFLLFDLNKEEKTRVIKNAEKLDTFMPWGYKLFGDFEELYIESVSFKDLSLCDGFIAEKINPDGGLFNFSDKFSKFSQMYKVFYETLLVERGFSSRSCRYRFIADNEAALSAVLPGKVIMAGFYGITGTESAIFEKILKNKREDACIVSKAGGGISVLLKKLGLPDRKNENEAINEYSEEIFHNDGSVKFYFNNTSSMHNEIMKLKETIKNSKGVLSSKDLILLSSEDYLFPLIHNVLNSLNKEDYNVSIGYSLKRTPLYALFNLMAVLHSRKKEDKFYAKDYISLFLHPYVKNISGKLSGLPQFAFNAVQARMFFHSIESYIKKNKILFISIKDLENSEPVVNVESGMKEYFQELNKIFIFNFENIANIKDFIEKIIKIIDTVSNNSTADRHPYGLKFIESALKGIMEFESINFFGEETAEESGGESKGGNSGGGWGGIDISSYKFDGISGYFGLLKNILKRQKVPFRGTPLKGLQVLGPLEARIINFDRIFYLGANEGTLPNVSKENTVLTEDVRKFLSIPAANESVRLQEYNFFNLISGAKEVHFFYNDSNVGEKSRFIEKIIWDIQKKTGNLKEPLETKSVFKINFIQKEPSKLEKSVEVKKYLRNMDYSAGKLDAYLKCPSMFYYRYVLNLGEKEDIGDDIDAPGIGTIIHGVLKEYFEKFLHKAYPVSKFDLENEKANIYRILDKNFNCHGSGILNLQKKQIRSALNIFIEARQQYLSCAEVIGVEYPLNADMILKQYNNITIKLTGKADLILKKDGEYCIVDYKTGSTLTGPDKNFIPAAENRDEWLKMIKSVQLPFYIILFHNGYNEQNGACNFNITAKLWGLKKGGEYSIDLKDGQIFGSYSTFIADLIGEIINLDYFDFVQKERDKKICAYCSYSLLCGKINT